MQLGGLMSKHSLGMPPTSHGEGELGTPSPNQAGAELGWARGSPLSIPRVSPHPAPPAEPGLFPGPPNQQGQGSFWAANTQPSQIISSLSQSTTPYNQPCIPPGCPRVPDPKWQEKAGSPFVLSLISRSAALIIDPAAGQGNLSCPG